MFAQRRDKSVIRNFRRDPRHEDIRGFGKSHFRGKMDFPEVNTTKPNGSGSLLVHHLKQVAALGFLLRCFDLLGPNASNELG